MSCLKPIKFSLILGLIAASLIGLGWSALSEFLNPWEWSTLDARLHFADSRQTNSSIVLIGRDSRSEEKFGVGLWDRSIFATVIESLGQVGASVIALDFHFAGESPPERGGMQSDAALVHAVRSAKKVILPLAVTVSPRTPSSRPQSLPPELDAAIEPISSLSISTENIEVLPQAQVLSPPLTGLAPSALGIGHIAADPDSDGVYRRIPSFLTVGKQLVPALGVAAVAAYWNISPRSIRLHPGNHLQFQNNGKNAPPFMTIPIDDQGRFFIRYAGRWTDNPFPYFSFVDVWEAIQEGREAEIKNHMSGKIILLMHAALSSDKRRTPLETSVPGGFVHANAIHTLLSGNGLREPSNLETGLLMMGVGVLVAWMGLALPLGTYVGGVILFALSYLGVSHTLLRFGDLALPILPVLGTIGASMTMAFVYARWHSGHQIRTLEQEKIRLHRAIATTQELLTKQESQAEQLEDDLATLRDQLLVQQEEKETLQHQIEPIQRNLLLAQDQEQSTRRRLKELEQRLESGRAFSVAQAPLPIGTLKALQQECQTLGVLTQDPVLLKSFRDLKRVANGKTPIRILGEPGTGKELFARAAHRLSPHAHGPFVAVNMSAIPTDLFESEMFGHKKGAFTGAAQDRPGLYESAHGGTLFLDEIGDLPLHQQAKLLRVLQEGVFTRVGEANPRSADVRIISATNKDLVKGIAEGWFREDLYYRLKGLEVRLPPLRERPDDLPLLATEIVNRITSEQGTNQVKLSQEALNAVQGWPWKGNIRELLHCLETAVSLAEHGVIRPEDLRLSSEENPVPREYTEKAPTVPDGDPKKDDAVLLVYLRQHSFDLQATGQTLGWDRSTIMQRLKGMCFQTLVEKKGDVLEAAASLAGEPGLTRLVHVKLKEYVQHLKKVIATFPTEDGAKAGCRKRFRNLPERYHEALSELVKAYFGKDNP